VVLRAVTKMVSCIQSTLVSITLLNLEIHVEIGHRTVLTLEIIIIVEIQMTNQKELGATQPGMVRLWSMEWSIVNATRFKI